MNIGFSFTIFGLLIQLCDIFLLRIYHNYKFRMRIQIVFAIDKFINFRFFVPICDKFFTIAFYLGLLFFYDPYKSFFLLASLFFINSFMRLINKILLILAIFHQKNITFIYLYWNLLQLFLLSITLNIS